MKRVSNAYKTAIAKPLRDHFYMVVSIGVISNEAQSSAKIISDMHYLSNNISLFKGKEVTNRYATLEENTFTVDGSLIFPPENDEYLQLASVVSALSKDILGSVTVQFDNAYDIKGLTINFGRDYPTELNIVINNEDTYTYTNEDKTFYTFDNYDSVQTITIEPVSFINGDNKRLRIESMQMGVGLVFQNEDIINATNTDANSFVSETLPHIDYSVTCYDKNKWFNVDDRNSFINYLQTGQALNVSIGLELEDSSIEWLKMPKTYLTKWKSDGQNVTLTSKDRISVNLGDEYSDSNYIHERTLYDEADRVCVSAGLEPDDYIIDEILKNTVITAPMPIVSHAQALQLIANAGRCALKQDSEGRIVFIPNFENIVEPTDLVVETDTQAAWSKPSNIRMGSNIVYADMTRNFFSVDGSMYFLPENGESYLETGYVSRDIADDAGDFTTNPSLSITLPATYTYYCLYINFKGNVPSQMVVRTYKTNELIDTITINELSETTVIPHEFYSFDRMEFEIIKGTPNDRVLISEIYFGNLTDYRLTKEVMKNNPLGTVETKVKDVRVKIFTYVNEERTLDGETTIVPKEIDDNVYAVQHLNNAGEDVTFKNPLITTETHAQLIAEWLGNYYANNITYTVDYRGDPRLESADYIFMDSDVINNLQVEIDSHTLKFDGGLSGSLKLRRAIDMIE